MGAGEFFYSVAPIPLPCLDAIPSAFIDSSRDSKRTDGTAGSPFSAWNKVDDLFFFVQSEGRADVNLLVDEVVLYDANERKR